jgi:hypothetical protein
MKVVTCSESWRNSRMEQCRSCKQMAQFKMCEEETKNLTVEQCGELAAAIAEEAALLSPGLRKEALLNLAHNYRGLAKMKSLIGRRPD